MSKDSILKDALREIEPLYDASADHRTVAVAREALTRLLDSALDAYALSIVEQTVSEHNARVLNEFQLQGTRDMPMIAYDERVCLIPAMTKATEQTLENARKLTGRGHTLTPTTKNL